MGVMISLYFIVQMCARNANGLFWAINAVFKEVYEKKNVRKRTNVVLRWTEKMDCRDVALQRLHRIATSPPHCNVSTALQRLHRIATSPPHCNVSTALQRLHRNIQ